MRHFLVYLFLFSVIAFTQQEKSGCVFKNSVSGTIYQKTVYHGGIQIDDDAISPWPLANANFHIVEWNGADSLPTFVQSFQTDPNGFFKIHLPPGIYGIVAENDLDSLVPGQWLPASSESGDQWNSSNSWWECNTVIPFNLTSCPVENISLIHQLRTYCYICP